MTSPHVQAVTSPDEITAIEREFGSIDYRAAYYRALDAMDAVEKRLTQSVKDGICDEWVLAEVRRLFHGPPPDAS